jgi:hypothetical protein
MRLGAELDQLAREPRIEPRVEAQVEVGGVVEVHHRPAVPARSQQTLDRLAGAQLLLFGVGIGDAHRRAHAVDVDDGARHLGEDAGVLAHDLSAEAVTDQDRALELELPDHRVQVRDEVAHGVRARLVAVAVAAQVERHHVVVAAERLGQRLEREREVLDAVHQHQRAAERLP